MGYFPNGTSGEIYQEEYCFGCRHDDPDKGCPVWMLHMLHNYQECNKADSMLHVLIPRTKDGLGNETCTMYLPKAEDRPLFPNHCERCGEVYHGGPCK